MTENGYGFDAIHAHRLAARPVAGGSKERRIRLEILTLGDDLATVHLEYKDRPVLQHLQPAASPDGANHDPRGPGA